MDVVGLNVLVGGTSTFIASIDVFVPIVFLYDRLLFVIRHDLIESFIADIVDV